MRKESRCMIVLAAVFLVTTGGCITIRFETEIEKPTGIEITFEAPAEKTPVSEATAMTPTQTETPLVAPSSFLLFDNFENTVNSQGYDPSLWVCWGCNIGNTMYQDDSIRFEINALGHVDIASISSFPSTEFKYVQARLNLFEYEGVDDGDVHVSLFTEAATGFWQAVCWIAGRQEPTEQPVFQCVVVITSDANQENYQYFSNGVPVNYSEWHTGRIELNPATFEVRFYFDNKLIGGYTPPEADLLKGKYLRTQIGCINRSISHSVAG